MVTGGWFKRTRRVDEASLRVPTPSRVPGASSIADTEPDRRRTLGIVSLRVHALHRLAGRTISESCTARSVRPDRRLTRGHDRIGRRPTPLPATASGVLLRALRGLLLAVCGPFRRRRGAVGIERRRHGRPRRDGRERATGSRRRRVTAEITPIGSYRPGFESPGERTNEGHRSRATSHPCRHRASSIVLPADP